MSKKYTMNIFIQLNAFGNKFSTLGLKNCARNGFLSMTAFPTVMFRAGPARGPNRPGPARTGPGPARKASSRARAGPGPEIFHRAGPGRAGPGRAGPIFSL